MIPTGKYHNVHGDFQATTHCSGCAQGCAERLAITSTRIHAWLFIHGADSPKVKIGTGNDGPVYLSRVQVAAGHVNTHEAAGAGSVDGHAVGQLAGWPPFFLQLYRGRRAHLGPFKLKKWLIRLLSMARPMPTTAPGALSSGFRA